MAGRLIPCLLALLPACAMAAPGADAEQLPDPTRPPADFAQPATGTATPGTAEGTGGGLQSIILRKGGRPAAVIHGYVVELGGMVGEARLVKVNEDSVVLLGPTGRETLFLTPSAEKRGKADAGGKTRPIGMNAYREEKVR